MSGGLVKMRRGLIIVAFNGIILTLLVGMGEVAVRVFDLPFGAWDPPENAIARFDSDLGWSYEPGLSRQVDFVINRERVHIDRHGARVASASSELEPTRPTLILVGGSFAMGHGLPYEATVAGRVGLALPDLQVANFAVQAFGTDQSLLMLQRQLPRFATVQAVYIFIDHHVVRNGNADRNMLMPGGRFISTTPHFALDGAGGVRLHQRPVPYEEYGRFALFDLIYAGVGRRLGLYPPRPERLTRALVTEMSASCQRHGARFVVVNWRWNDADFDGFGDLDIDLIDTLEKAPEDWAEMRLADGSHPNAEANHHVSRLLLRYLASRAP